MTENGMLFAKSVRTLLAKTFVVRDRNEKIYNFCRNEGNKAMINQYLESIGYYITVDGVLGIVQLHNTTELENELGTRSDSLYTFSPLEQLYLMLFRQYYDEHPYEQPVIISRSNFLEQVLSYAPSEKKTTYTSTLRKLKYFNIINYKSDIAYGPLFEGFGICGGYSDTMALFLEHFDIKNYKVSSDKHVWNAVYLDGVWYHLDLTWDDPVTQNNINVLTDDFFLISSNELINKDVSEHQFDVNVYSELKEA